jgi:hypothetical protein
MYSTVELIQDFSISSIEMVCITQQAKLLPIGRASNRPKNNPRQMAGVYFNIMLNQFIPPQLLENQQQCR